MEAGDRLVHDVDVAGPGQQHEPYRTSRHLCAGSRMGCSVIWRRIGWRRCAVLLVPCRRIPNRVPVESARRRSASRPALSSARDPVPRDRRRPRRPRQGQHRLRGAQGEHLGRGQEQHPDEGRDHALRAVRGGRARPDLRAHPARALPWARSSGRKLARPKGLPGRLHGSTTRRTEIQRFLELGQAEPLQCISARIWSVPSVRGAGCGVGAGATPGSPGRTRPRARPAALPRRRRGDPGAGGRLAGAARRDDARLGPRGGGALTCAPKTSRTCRRTSSRSTASR